MFTEKAQICIDLAKDYAFSNGSTELNVSAILTSIRSQAETEILLTQCLGTSFQILPKTFPDLIKLISCPGKLSLGEAIRVIIACAKNLAEDMPDRLHPGLIDIRHLVCAVAMSSETANILNVSPIKYENAKALIAKWYEQDINSPRLDDLTFRLRIIRDKLLAKIFGQNQAVHTFIEGLFNAEIVATADVNRKSPRALFVFAGPPGVGKTYLAELCALFLDRPFKRFDMSAYSGHQQNEALIGMAKSFHAAHPGTLTEFVEKNPNALLLFDEIEKAHLNTIQLFLQILDAGSLEDKYHERNVFFRDTIVIFTTNAGRRLYNKPNANGVHTANAAFHRKTILDALEIERDPHTGESCFPAAICSRLATGYPVLFNCLGVNELEAVVQSELTRVANLLSQQYYKHIEFDKMIAMCLILREGARADARTLRSQAETFVKTEVFKFCQLFKADRLGEVFKSNDRIRFALNLDASKMDSDIKALFEQQELPKVLFVADEHLTKLYQKTIPELDWQISSEVNDALQILAEKDIDFVLLDIWIGRISESNLNTIDHFDHAPAAAKSLEQGQELLRKIRERLPNMPVYLLSIIQTEGGEQICETVDDELFIACVRGGGARGLINSKLISKEVEGWNSHRIQLVNTLLETSYQLHREKIARQLGRERKVLSFDTVPRITRQNREISIFIRNLHLSRAIAAADAGEIIEDVERPQTKFDEVIGAGKAKEELMFFIDYLRNPKRFAALGLKPPKGVLLYGPPGTGKTMLARAMAGESNVAFIAASASSFVTVWQGSGPQNIRDLFLRARRYAPAIIFIDEIDAIGKTRSGHVGVGQSEENTLNALLTEMDGFSSLSPDNPVFLLAATNFGIESDDKNSSSNSSRTLDPALIRRFSRCIKVELPDRDARKKYLSTYQLKSKHMQVSEAALDLLLDKSVGMSIANLEHVLETATRNAFRLGVNVTDELLIDALDLIREGEMKDWAHDLLINTAKHEAGHTVMYWLSGWLSPEVSIIARADHGGGMRRCEEEMKRESVTSDELRASIRTCLGGRAAEILYSNSGQGLTTGASNDLEQATRIARLMICKYGMSEEFGILSVPELFNHPEALSSPLYLRANEIASKILKEEMDKTLFLLKKHWEKLEKVTQELMVKNRLYRNDLEAILCLV